MQPRILAFAGSTRQGSWNRAALEIAVAGASAAGVEVTRIDLRQFPLPLYDQDVEAAQGIPENAVRLKQIFVEHQGLLLASPEYNSSVSPLLKNTLDWVSRPAPGEKSLIAFQGKLAGLVAASPGALGGLRGLVHLRAILGNIGVLVIPEQQAVVRANQVFGAEGKLSDAAVDAGLKNVGAQLASWLLRTNRPN